VNASSFEPFADLALDPPLRGFLHRPRGKVDSSLVLAHGAGSNAHAPLLVALADTFAQLGMAVLRCDLPYRQIRSSGPPRPKDAARDREGLANALRAMTKEFAGETYLGGHSYGGRQGSMLAGDHPELVAGLLLSSYPLHPPSQPARLRTEHLPRIKAPTLFVHGTKDPFGSIHEIEAARRLIAARTELLAVAGVGHDLGFGRRITQGAGDLPARISKAFKHLFV